jgi:16S rRNA (guanine1207-N2)-methyltransferase
MQLVPSYPKLGRKSKLSKFINSRAPWSILQGVLLPFYDDERCEPVSEHYYTPKPTVDHDRRVIEAVLRGRTLKFETDAGVFSKSGIDYGSRLLIETMDITAQAQVLDMGCGYGPIGLCAALLAQYGLVTMADVNERALQLSERNARLNGIMNVRMVQSDLFSGLVGEEYTHILTNPPIRAGKQLVHQLFDDAYSHLRDGGELWTVIQKKQGAASAYSKLEERYKKVDEVERAKGYWIIRAIK